MKRSPFDRVNAIFASEAKTGLQKNDLISVIVTSFNYRNYIIECLESVREQTHEYVELIVIDDNSSDDSVDIICDWMKKNHQRFCGCYLYSHPWNRGLAFARNTGISKAAGENIFTLDADNTIYPRALARLLETMKNSGADAAYSQLERFGDSVGLGLSDIFRAKWLEKMNYIDAMAIIRKEAIQKIGNYQTDGGWEDYDLWCKFVDAGMVAIFLPEILCRYRVSSNSMLRVESYKRKLEIAIRLSVRHPWLELS